MNRFHSRRFVRRAAAAAAGMIIGDTSEGRALRAKVATVPFWFHSIELGAGVTTPGVRSLPDERRELAALKLPDLHGKTVLDIGAWDGFFSFAAEERGAARVVACDQFVWALDREAKDRYRSECQAASIVLQAFDRVPQLWRFDELPGKRGFDLAHAARRSRVEPLVADYLTMNPGAVGPFDVVLYLGVLYHMENPLAALRRVRDLTREVAIIETEAVVVGGFERTPMSEFFPPGAKLLNDPTNFWAPNVACLAGLCRAAGFSRVKVLTTPPSARPGRLERYRLIAHALV
jgi:tRNA (mo5U34)-methyltransferase